MQSSILIELHRSRFLDALLLAVHGTAGGCLFVVPIPDVLCFFGIGLLFVSLWKALHRPEFERLHLTESGIVLYAQVTGPPLMEAVVLPETSVFVFLIVLCLRQKEGGGRVNLVVLPGQLSTAEFRRLRVWLRWKVKSGATSGDE